jgi:hypothetical protein
VPRLARDIEHDAVRGEEVADLRVLREPRRLPVDRLALLVVALAGRSHRCGMQSGEVLTVEFGLLGVGAVVRSGVLRDLRHPEGLLGGADQPSVGRGGLDALVVHELGREVVALEVLTGRLSREAATRGAAA